MRSIRARLALSIVVGGGALLALLFSALDVLIDYQLYSRFDEALVARGRALADELVSGDAGVPTSAQGWPEFRTGSHTDYYQLWNAAGATVAHSPSSRGRDLQAPPAVGGERPVLYDIQLPDGHRGRAAAFGVGGGASFHTFVIAAEREALDALEDRIHVLLVAGTGVAVLLMVTLSYTAVRAGLRPLERFGSETAARALAPEANPPPAAPLPDELQPIAAALDGAFGELARTLLRERRFARDLAHELRTPLAEMFSLVETLQPADPGSREKLALLASRLTGMTRIVDGLLALARYEAGIDAPALEPVDAASMLRALCRGAAARASARGIGIDEQIDAELWLITDSLLLERILSNLLGNAIDHAPADSRVTVCGRAQGSDVSLAIANAAPGLTPGDVVRLGERHFRASGSTAEGDHAGLGLALCAALASRLDLRLAFALEDGMLWVRLAGLRTLEAGV